MAGETSRVGTLTIERVVDSMIAAGKSHATRTLSPPNIQEEYSAGRSGPAAYYFRGGA